MRQNGAGRRFEPASGLLAVERVRAFVSAQGWAGLTLGSHLERAVASGVDERDALHWVEGEAGEARAVALLHEGALGLLAPFPEDRDAAKEFLLSHQDQLTRISLLEGQLDDEGLTGFSLFPRQMAVSEGLRDGERELPPTRLATPDDAEPVHLIYQEVGWMRQESAEVWRERLQRERCWVAELDGQPVAAARWTLRFGSWVEVGGVATRSDHRRLGAAAAVTRAATGAALEEGLRVALRFGDRELASLYFPLGFEPVGRELALYRS